jgi:hypothetical protein
MTSIRACTTQCSTIISSSWCACLGSITTAKDGRLYACVTGVDPAWSCSREGLAGGGGKYDTRKMLRTHAHGRSSQKYEWFSLVCDPPIPERIYGKHLHQPFPNLLHYTGVSAPVDRVIFHRTVEQGAHLQFHVTKYVVPVTRQTLIPACRRTAASVTVMDIIIRSTSTFFSVKIL